MNLEKVIFGFFVLLAATLNFGFFIGDIGNPEVHNVYELFAALAVSLIATVLKFGDRTQLGAVHLATSLVADLQLGLGGDRLGLGPGNLRGRRKRDVDGQHGVVVRRGVAGQPGVGRAAGG